MLLAETLDMRDVGTARHSQTVGRYAEEIARALGLPEAHVERIRAAGVLHDIGKLGVADAVLKKPGALTDEEWAEMRRHPELGARILDHANLRDISAWVLAHHERIDGRGYPHGLAGDVIPLEARILAVADAYEAMTADRAYRAALGPRRRAARSCATAPGRSSIRRSWKPSWRCSRRAGRPGAGKLALGWPELGVERVTGQHTDKEGRCEASG